MSALFIFMFVFFVTGIFANDCTYIASDGSFYDLSPLSESENFKAALPNSDATYAFGVCREASLCGNAACEITEETNENILLGDINQLSWSEEGTHAGKGVTLVYGGGNSCDGSEGTSEFLVNFVCDHGTEFDLIDVGFECDKNFVRVRSKYACGNKMEKQEIEDDSADSMFYTILIASFAISATIAIVVAVALITFRTKSEDNLEEDTIDEYEHVQLV